jgi:hypothetical protein
MAGTGKEVRVESLINPKQYKADIISDIEAIREQLRNLKVCLPVCYDYLVVYSVGQLESILKEIKGILFERVSEADDEEVNKKEKLGGVRSDEETLTTEQKRILRELTKTPRHYAYGEKEFKDFKIELEKYLRVCDRNQRY